MEAKKYPIGIQNFEKVRREGYAYVDKTALMYKMTSEGSYYFLSRPRRFGKSLLLSTLECYFSGKKDLFEGLAVDSLEKEWSDYPILHLDLNSREYKDEASLEAELNRHLEKWESIYGDTFHDRAAEERFLHIIDFAFEKTGFRFGVTELRFYGGNLNNGSRIDLYVVSQRRQAGSERFLYGRCQPGSGSEHDIPFGRIERVSALVHAGNP